MTPWPVIEAHGRYGRKEHRVAAKIRRFRDLPKGWHYGSGGPCSATTAETAIAVLRAICKLEPQSCEAFPEEDGGVLVCGYTGLDMVEALCWADGTFDFVLELDNEDIDYAERIGREVLDAKIKGAPEALRLARAMSRSRP